MTEWLNNVFFPTNKRRLKEAQNKLVDGLAEIGIPVLKSSGGLYVWADFRKVRKAFGGFRENEPKKRKAD